MTSLYRASTAVKLRMCRRFSSGLSPRSRLKPFRSAALYSISVVLYFRSCFTVQKRQSFGEGAGLKTGQIHPTTFANNDNILWSAHQRPYLHREHHHYNEHLFPMAHLGLLPHHLRHTRRPPPQSASSNPYTLLPLPQSRCTGPPDFPTTWTQRCGQDKPVDSRMDTSKFANASSRTDIQRIVRQRHSITNTHKSGDAESDMRTT